MKQLDASRQVNFANFTSLELAWSFPIKKKIPDPKTLGEMCPSKPLEVMESTPIVSGDFMYITTWHDLYALKFDPPDGTKAHLAWHYPLSDWEPDDTTPCKNTDNLPYAVYYAMRGAAAQDGTIYVTDRNSYLHEINAVTGQLRAKVDLLSGIAHADRKAYVQSSPPTVAGDLVVVGAGGSENDVQGFVTARPLFGKTATTWTFCTVPGPDVNNKPIACNDSNSVPLTTSWPKDIGAHGGAGVWMTPVVYPVNQLIIFGTGNPRDEAGGDSWGIHRPGNNLFANSVVALDFQGHYKFAFQEVHHDLWDYDQSSAPIVTPGFVGAAGKTGWW